MNFTDIVGDLLDSLRSFFDGERSRIQTHMPGIIVSYDPNAQTAVVQPAIKGKKTAPDGSAQFVSMPQLLDVPVHFPSGGGVVMTFPIKAGDECLVHFGSRDMSAWWQSGGEQAPIDARMHDLSDAFCEVGVRSQANKLPGGSHPTNVELRSTDGTRKVSLDPSGPIAITSANKVTIAGAAGIELTSPTLTHNGTNIGNTHKHTAPNGATSTPF